jgi:hypothetical protein
VAIPIGIGSSCEHTITDLVELVILYIVHVTLYTNWFVMELDAQPVIYNVYRNWFTHNSPFYKWDGVCVQERYLSVNCDYFPSAAALYGALAFWFLLVTLVVLMIPIHVVPYTQATDTKQPNVNRTSDKLQQQRLMWYRSA